MRTSDADRKRHLTVEEFSTNEAFSPVPGRSASPEFPPRQRSAHAHSLLTQLHRARDAINEFRSSSPTLIAPRSGFTITFEGTAELAYDRLDRPGVGIELLNVKETPGRVAVTVFVPEGGLVALERLLAEYEAEDSKSGKPRHTALFAPLEVIRAAAFHELWTDDDEALPASDDESIWWEVWLPKRLPKRIFSDLASSVGLEVSSRSLEFPERSVVLVKGTKASLTSSIPLLNSIAEIRRPKTIEELFDSEEIDADALLDDLLTRLRLDQSANVAVCVLDTGIAPSNPLLKNVVLDTGLLANEPGWSPIDAHGHGTQMAGLAMFGDLAPIVRGADIIEVNHSLESIKIIEDDGDNDGANWGEITVRATYSVEVESGVRQRVFSMSIASAETRDLGRPTSWSAAIDMLAFDNRLFVLCAGNLHHPHQWNDYPNSNSLEGIHDPGQAWNALTVGAYTMKDQLPKGVPEDAKLVAPVGGLSPFSSTSRTWISRSPLKPDVVMEGGNAFDDGKGPIGSDTLSLLTTNHDVGQSAFTITGATSAATAQVARAAAIIRATYPNLRAATVRGLIVHSARWTDTMRQQFLGEGKRKEDIQNLVRHVGFGVPDLDRALWSVENELTLISESQLKPFEKSKNKNVRAAQLGLHTLPWPVGALEELGSQPVTMRVTLSYFIEPNPSSRGTISQYRYQSHGLRFDVKRPDESIDQFRARINQIARDLVDDDIKSGDGGGWLLGKQLRHRGSLHQDDWTGPAEELALRGCIAVYPTSGWWKYRKRLKRFNECAEYSLIVSILSDDQEVELYTSVENMISSRIEILT